MVISSTLTTQLDNVRAPAPLSRTRPRSVPIYTSKTPTTPNPSHSEPKRRRPYRQKFIDDRPPFINYASAYINPYRSLSPITVYPHSRRCSRSKSRNSKRKQKRPVSFDNLIESPYTNEQDSQMDESTVSTKFIINQNPIDINPSDLDAFDRKFSRRRQMIITNPFYREKVDTWKASSLNHLITLISELISEKKVLDRIWIIYYWISQNIRYDIDADFNSHNRHQKAEEVFRTGKSTCEGYASIFKTLCDALLIPCEKIIGYAKDYSFKIDRPNFSEPNHTWNAVQFNNNHWYLIDSAWGTGYIDGNHEYKKDLKLHYFLTHPEHMIYNHLPEESRWQLLAKPITMDDYLRLPHVHSYYFIYDLNIIYPRFSSRVSFNAKQSFAEVLIQAPNDIQLTCSIKDDLRSTSLTQYDYNRQVWQCLFSPYKIGFHTLIIFASEISTTNLFKNVIELGVEVLPRDFIRGKTLPITFGKFTEYQCQIITPLDGILKRGRKVTIRCRIPNASTARISLDGIWLDEVKLKNEIFKQQINVPDREVIVYAEFIHNKRPKIYDGLIRYAVEK
jgi:transglutaminase-like putative cysteine protease